MTEELSEERRAQIFSDAWIRHGVLQPASPIVATLQLNTSTANSLARSLEQAVSHPVQGQPVVTEAVRLRQLEVIAQGQSDNHTQIMGNQNLIKLQVGNEGKVLWAVILISALVVAFGLLVYTFGKDAFGINIAVTGGLTLLSFFAGRGQLSQKC
jgi:hypothetical protein